MGSVQMRRKITWGGGEESPTCREGGKEGGGGAKAKAKVDVECDRK